MPVAMEPSDTIQHRYAFESDPSTSKQIDQNAATFSEEAFHCTLCRSLLYNPVTTSCGHTFCKSCILTAMEHNNRCPLCRGVVNVTPDFGVNILLQQLIVNSFPAAAAARKAEIEAELDEEHTLQLFSPGAFVLLPSQPLRLHVVEPRYRAMAKRCMAGSRRFGVVASTGDKLAPIGVCSLIQNYHPYPDGRCLLQSRGSDRFRILELREMEGVKVARVEYFHDVPAPTEPTHVRLIEQKLTVLAGAAELYLGAEGFVKAEEKSGAAPRSDAAEFSWWLGSVLQIPAQGKYQLLGMRSAEARLDLLMALLHTLRTEGNLNSFPFDPS